MNLNIQTKTMDTTTWLLAIFVAFLLGISFSVTVFVDIQHIDALNEIYCKSWDISYALFFDECVKTINDREFF